MTVLKYQATAPLNLDTSQLVTSPDAAGQAEQFMTQRFIQMATDREVLSRACAASRAPHCDTTSRAPRVLASTRNTRGIIQISVSALRRRRASARPVERGDVAGSEQEHPSPDSEAMRR